MADPLIDMRTTRLTIGVGYAQLNRYIAQGRLKVFRIGPRGHRKIRLSSLRAFLAEGESQGVKS
jgi:hypothetical protein